MSDMWKKRHASREQDKRDAIMLLIIVISFIVSGALKLSGLF